MNSQKIPLARYIPAKSIKSGPQLMRLVFVPSTTWLVVFKSSNIPKTMGMMMPPIVPEVLIILNTVAEKRPPRSVQVPQTVG